MEKLAHRTAKANAPPNSLEGLKFCYSQGIRIVECDVSFTKDEKPIIWHDDDNHLLKLSDRPAGARMLISEMTLEEIRGLERNDSSEKLLVMEDIRNFLKTHPGFRILFDVKYYWKRFGVEADFWGIVGRIPRHLIDLTLKHVVRPAMEEGLIGQIGFVTFSGGRELLETVKSIDRRIFTSLIVVQPGFQAVDCLEYVDAITIGWGWHGRNHWRFFPGSVERLVSEARQNGRAAWGGLVRNESDLEWLVYHGLGGAWTDDIDMVREILAAEI